MRVKDVIKSKVWLYTVLPIAIFWGIPKACGDGDNNHHKCYRRVCYNHEEETKYPIVHYMSQGSETYLNDSIVVVRTRIKGLDNYETTIVNLKNTK